MNKDKDVEEASRLLAQLPKHERNKPKRLGSNENYFFQYVPGKHGAICMIVPNKETTEEEWIEFHRFMVDIAVRRAIRKGKEEAAVASSIS
jgi:hypothetical protein